MPHIHIKVGVRMTVLGPILTAGSAEGGWGLDAVFYRDWNNTLAIPGSHIRGKLRESMATVEKLLGNGLRQVCLLFGEESGDNVEVQDSFAPQRGCLKVSDFVYQDYPVDNAFYPSSTRIRIDPETGTVQKGALIVTESPFASGQETFWKGSVEFFAEESKVESTLESLEHAFRFINAVGADKTVGYGRVTGIRFEKAEKTFIQRSQAQIAETSVIKLALAPQEPLMVGGFRQTDNMFISESIIPGTVLKGALAAGMNRLAGNPALHEPIHENNTALQSLSVPMLIRFFSRLRFLHATPSNTPFHRIPAIALSMAQYGDIVEDVAFETDENRVYAWEKQPVAFSIDWKGTPKNIPKQYKPQNLDWHSVTRTAIDETLRKANDSQLYSFCMIKPVVREEGTSHQVYWNSEIHYPESLSSKEKAALTEEILRVLPLGMRYVGKRQCVVSVSNQFVEHRQGIKRRLLSGERFVIVLETPAIMIDPWKLAQNAKVVFDDHEIIRGHYESFWKDIFGEGSVRMDTWFATQFLSGGFLGMRFRNKHYCPFYLTSRGSTFVFTAEDDSVSQTLEDIFKTGLSFPKWAKDMYGTEPWRRCPFIAENGYGEIRVEFEKQGEKSHEKI